MGRQNWLTFLRNHKDAIAAMDFFVVPTAPSENLGASGRRRILHFNVTPNPTALWVIQQLREPFPDEPAHRFLIYDNDAIFSTAVSGAIKSFEIRPRRTAFRSPWQNGIAERFVGSVRREQLLVWITSVVRAVGEDPPQDASHVCEIGMNAAVEHGRLLERRIWPEAERAASWKR